MFYVYAVSKETEEQHCMGMFATKQSAIRFVESFAQEDSPYSKSDKYDYFVLDLRYGVKQNDIVVGVY